MLIALRLILMCMRCTRIRAVLYCVDYGILVYGHVSAACFASSPLLTYFSLSIAAQYVVQYSCEDKFEGGGWALVRRVKAGSTWHPATDNVTGIDVYGTPGSSTSDLTFSLPFLSLITSNQTQFLFATGM
jgi:hypothetical protein